MAEDLAFTEPAQQHNDHPRCQSPDGMTYQQSPSSKVRSRTRTRGRSLTMSGE